jgi:glycosyltransferase involved in cell wall biosynthesis
MDEVWVPCKQNVEAFKRSGVNIPIYVIPHTFNNDLNFKLEPDEDNFSTIAQLGDSFVFYSIFQWLERKNPVGTLKAYLSEFSDQENVSMIIKTYISNPEDVSETNKLRSLITEVKKLLRLNAYPKLYLVTNILSRVQMALLHQRGDCYIHLARAEGFGQPITEAMLAKNPVIVCGYGGPEDYVQHNVNGFLVDYQMTPVYGMPWNTYTAKMNWAEPDISQTRKYMRALFENREMARVMGQEGYKYISTNNSWTNIGNLMVKRLKKIEEMLNG